MSVKEMEQMDEELMSVVNNHAAPAAVADAEEIVEQMTEKKPADTCDCLQETSDGYHITKKQFDELESKVEKTLRHKTIAAVIICVVMMVVLLMVLAKPSLLIWLVNIGVAICCVITGIAIDRWCRR